MRIRRKAEKFIRRATGIDLLTYMKYELWVKTLPRRVVCWVVGHKYGEKTPAITDGPITVHPRERDYFLLAFHEQCERCYDIRQATYSDEEKDAAIEESIQDDLEEWPELEKWLKERAI